MKDLKKYNKFFLCLVFFTFFILIIEILFNFFTNNTERFYYLTSDLSIIGETQLIPKNYNKLQIVRFYFAGPINVKKFKKDIFHQLEIEKVFYINNVCKIILSNDTSLIFKNYPQNIKEKIALATFLSLKNLKDFKNLKSIEFFIFEKIKDYSFTY